MVSVTLDPSQTNTAYIPDQLIAGSFNTVTDFVTVAAGQVLPRGALLGQQTGGVFSVVSTPLTTAGSANTGNGTIGSVTTGIWIQLGTYRVTMTSATSFNVYDPTGGFVGRGTTGTAFTSPQVNFTITAGGTAFAAPWVSAALNTSGTANTGNGTIGSVTAGAQIQLGTYRVTMTSATAFNVYDPTSMIVGSGTAGTAFTSSQVNFTITAGGTAFAANDGFNLAPGVSDGFNLAAEAASGSGAGYYVLATSAAQDGSQNPANWAILAEDTNTSSTGTNAATLAPVYSTGEVDGNYLTLGTGLSVAGVKLALRQKRRRLNIKTGAIIAASL